MAWQNIPKPSTQAYTNLNPMGKEQYDQADITYDSATTFYDGTNPNQWTDVAKPSTNAWISVNKPT